MSIKSNINEDQNGMMIEIIAGIKKKIKPVNHRKGTTVSVKKLFFSTLASTGLVLFGIIIFG